MNYPLNKVLLFGSKGFVSGYLKHYLKGLNYDIHEFNLRDGQDIRDYEQVRNTIESVKPDLIFVLAAMAAPAESFHSPARAFEVNTVGTVNILEAVRRLDIKARILLCGTSEEYGPQPPKEDGYLEPRSPYAVSKMAMDQMGQLYTKAYGMHIVVTRAFNHTGPGRGEMYAESSFAKQIARFEKTKGVVEIQHGNLDSIRNFSDVRDIVRAYQQAIYLPPGVYNICSDQNVTISYVLRLLLAMSSRDDIETVVNKSLIRPADFDFQDPECEKFTKLTGWKPEYTLEQTLRDLLDYWRHRV